MNHENLSQSEQVSALMDGQLTGPAFEQTVQVLAEVEEARADWYAFHLVGDVLRSQALAVDGERDAAFLARLRLRLQSEGRVEQPEFVTSMVAVPALQDGAGVIKNFDKASANDTSLRWKWVAGVACLAAATVLAWNLTVGVGAPAAPPQLAHVAAPVPDQPPAAMIRDPRLDEWLQAHQQLGGTSALQMPSGFLRNATFERPTQ